MTTYLSTVNELKSVSQKVCKYCGELKPLNEFLWRIDHRDVICKKCHCERQKKAYARRKQGIYLKPRKNDTAKN